MKQEECAGAKGTHIVRLMRCCNDVRRQILKQQVFASRNEFFVVEFNQISCLVLGPNAHYPVHLRETRSQRRFALQSASALQNCEGCCKHTLRIRVCVCVCVRPLGQKSMRTRNASAGPPCLSEMTSVFETRELEWRR